MYAGLRRGEVGGLRWSDVDLKAGTIQVQRSWGPFDGMGETKNRNRRHVPIPAVLREHLAAVRLRQPPGQEPCSPRPPIPSRPPPSACGRRVEGEGPGPPHPARLPPHVRQLMIAADVNAKTVSTYMGHAGVSITLDRYGHLMPVNAAEAAGLLDAYLEANQ